MWCLGNEMDGPWQIGHKTADDYGKLAAQVARSMRKTDGSIELVACGSSNREMPTHGEWERVVLEHTYDLVDYISCHAYFEEQDGDLLSFLASGTQMDDFIKEVVAAIDHVKSLKRTDKTVNISFDEWNIWYRSHYPKATRPNGVDEWGVVPRLLEDVYTVADAVAFGGLMITLLRNADRVTSASLAQLVNVIAPIMTEPGGPSWRQTTFFPFAQASALGRGEALQVKITSPSHSTDRYGEVSTIDAVATYDAARNATTVFAVNRGNTETVDLDIVLRGDLMAATVTATTLSDDDVYAANTLSAPERVTPQANDTAAISGSSVTVSLPPVSWTVIDIRH